MTTEFDRWAIRDQKVADRLDALFLDAKGSPLVAELKRDRAEDTVELQALKYAAYCAQLTLDELAEEYAAYHDVAVDEARQALLDHAPMVDETGLQAIKIRLIAGEFGPSVTSVVLWLREYGVDIGCVEVAVRQVAGALHAVISSRQLLPLPEAEDYLVRRRKRELEEDQARQGPLEGHGTHMHSSCRPPSSPSRAGSTSGSRATSRNTSCRGHPRFDRGISATRDRVGTTSP